VKPKEVKAILENLPHMSLGQAEWITRHIQAFGLKQVLEIGFMHGVSTCYFAAAVEPLDGHVTTLDLPYSLKREPNIHQLLDKCGLQQRVTVVVEPAGAAWRLMKMLPAQQFFDFCYIDAKHTWDCTGFLFFLVEKLLRPGGWLLFDDIKYSIGTSASRNAGWAAHLTDEERTICQVGKVWELLAKDHPGFCNFIDQSNWGLCQKKV
jgi:predicted O-methyltransferase YrrM